jgi:hypothetical protein
MNYAAAYGVGQALVKHKVFMSYHHRGDQGYYDAFSKAFHDKYETIFDNSLEREIDSDDTNYVMRRIRENHIVGTSCTIVLVGQNTMARKYVDWEIMATLEKQHGLIGVRLPTAPITSANKVIVPSRLYDNIQSGFALWVTWEEVTSNITRLNQYVADAKTRSPALIANQRPRMLQNT